MEFFYVYILKCSDNSYYVGHTDDLNTRLADHHNKKYSDYTSTRLPITCVFVERFQSRDEAFTMERKIKRWNRLKKEALINDNWSEIIRLSNYKK